MLRLLVVLLVLANAGFYSWRQGWLETVVSARPQGDREPGRLALQVSPEAVRVLAPLPNEASAREATTCLEIGPLTPTQLAPVEAALQTVLPAGAWVDQKTDVAPVWIVFMGPYAEREQRTKKTDELKRLNVSFEDVRNVPELGDGLALGRFNDRALAEKAVADMAARGVRTSRVAQLTPAASNHLLRVEQANLALQGRLMALPASSLQGRSFGPCSAP